jgi:hypothetical protein
VEEAAKALIRIIREYYSSLSWIGIHDLLRNALELRELEKLKAELEERGAPIADPQS